MTADCRGISLTDARKVSVCVEQTTGQVIYHPLPKRASRISCGSISTGVGGGRPVKFEAELTHLAPEEPEGLTTGEGVAADDNCGSCGHALGRVIVVALRSRSAGAEHTRRFVEISGTDIPLHEQLLRRLPPKAQELVRVAASQGRD